MMFVDPCLHVYPCNCTRMLKHVTCHNHVLLLYTHHIYLFYCNYNTTCCVIVTLPRYTCTQLKLNLSSNIYTIILSYICKTQPHRVELDSIMSNPILPPFPTINTVTQYIHINKVLTLVLSHNIVDLCLAHLAACDL